MKYILIIPIFFLFFLAGLTTNLSAQVQPNRNGYVHSKILVESGTPINGTGSFSLSFYKGNDTFIVNNNMADWYLGQDSGLSWDQPLVFINNSTKKIRINALNAENLQYVKFIGFGSDSAYGFEFYGGGVTAGFQGMIKGLVIEGCRFTGGNAGGVWIKEEAPHACDYLNYYTNVDTDPGHAKYRDPYQYLAVGNKPFDSVFFRHNMVDSCGGEALYLMSSGGFGRDNVGCLPLLPNGTRAYAPTQGRNFHIDSNYITYSGRTGIQGNLLVAGTNTINDNIIYNVGFEWAATGGPAAFDQGAGIRTGFASKGMECARNNVVKTFLYNIEAFEAANVHDNYCDSVSFVTYNGTLVQRPLTSPIAGMIASAHVQATEPMIIRSNVVKYGTASQQIKIAIYGGPLFLSAPVNDTCFNTGKLVLLSTPFNCIPTCTGGGTDTICVDSTYEIFYDSTVTTTVTRTIFYDSTAFVIDTAIYKPLRLATGATRNMSLFTTGDSITYHLSRDTTYDTTFVCSLCASKDTTVQVCIIVSEGEAMNRKKEKDYVYNNKSEMIISYGKCEKYGLLLY